MAVRAAIKAVEDDAGKNTPECGTTVLDTGGVVSTASCHPSTLSPFEPGINCDARDQEEEQRDDQDDDKQDAVADIG